MNARNLLASLLALVMLGAIVAEARTVVGTGKARGDYRNYAAQRSQRSFARTRMSYSYAPAVASAPVIVGAPTTPAPALAQAGTDARRFSYAPQAAAAPATSATTSPCPTVSTVVQPERRYSYAPAEATTATTSRAPRAYSSGPRYSQSRIAPSRALWGR